MFDGDCEPSGPPAQPCVREEAGFDVGGLEAAGFVGRYPPFSKTTGFEEDVAGFLGELLIRSLLSQRPASAEHFDQFVVRRTKQNSWISID